MELSIVIPTVTPRRRLLARLLSCLEPQVKDNPQVEVLIHYNDRIPLHEKFNQLNWLAKGRMVVQVDDDDLVRRDYVRQVLFAAALDVDPDFIGYKALVPINGDVANAKTYTIDPTRSGGHRPYTANDLIRHITPKCPVLTAQARVVPFKPGRNTDWQWVADMAATGFPHRPTFIDEVLYYYDCWPAYSLGSQRSEWPARHREIKDNFTYNSEVFKWWR